MRCYEVKAKVGDKVIATRFASTDAQARETRVEIVEKFGIKKSQVEYAQVEVPVDKPGLLKFINSLATKLDGANDGN